MAAGELQAIRKLEKEDQRSSFFSGALELDDWFQKFALENRSANNATTYVATVGDAVAGFYCIASAGVGRDLVPPSFGQRRPKDIPAILLARLAVHRDLHGKGIGCYLLQDVVARAVELSDSIGAACLLIHARDDQAKSFYCADLDVLSSPVEPLHLILPMKAARKMLRG